jgi:hypothetical protein
VQSTVSCEPKKKRPRTVAPKAGWSGRRHGKRDPRKCHDGPWTVLSPGRYGKAVRVESPRQVTALYPDAHRASQFSIRRALDATNAATSLLHIRARRRRKVPVICNSVPAVSRLPALLSLSSRATCSAFYKEQDEETARRGISFYRGAS